MPLVAHDTVLEHLRIMAVGEHLQVIIALNHQVVGTAHIMGRAVGNHTHIGSDDKTLALVLDAEAHALDVMTGLKSGDFHVQNPERYLLENGHMVVADAAADAAPLQHLAHHAHRAVDAAPAGTHGGIQAAHVVLVGMGEQDALDHVGHDAVALQLGEGLVEREGVLPLGILFLAVILHRLPDAGIDEDTATRSAQVSTVAAAATAETNEAQSLSHTRVGRGLGALVGL